MSHRGNWENNETTGRDGAAGRQHWICTEAWLMEENKIGSVVVVENRKPVGVLTERDFIRLVSRGQT